MPPAFFVHLAKPINIPREVSYGIAHRRFVILTIGSRGDVQPYIALGLGLRGAGHAVTIVTHGEYKAWVEGWGIRHRTAGGDPGALMKLNVEHKMFSPQFFRESIAHVSWPFFVRVCVCVGACADCCSDMLVVWGGSSGRG